MNLAQSGALERFTAASTGTIVALARHASQRRGSVRLSSATVWVCALAAVVLPTAGHAQIRYPPVYPAYRYAFAEADLRLKVKPKDASVYVDGYFAGKVEDYDGAFERLHVPPGQHEIVVYLDGFRSLHEKLYLRPNKTTTVEGDLQKLLPGDPAEPIPQPTTPPPGPNPGANRPP